MKFMAYHAGRPPPAGEIHNPNPPARADPRRSPPAAKIHNPNPLVLSVVVCCCLLLSVVVVVVVVVVEPSQTRKAGFAGKHLI